jgi:hypothetical protein
MAKSEGLESHGYIDGNQSLTCRFRSFFRFQFGFGAELKGLVAIRYSGPEPYTEQFSNKCWPQILIFVGRLGSWLSLHVFPAINSNTNTKFNLICIDMFPEIFTIPLSSFSTPSLPYISISHSKPWLPSSKKHVSVGLAKIF